MSIDDERNTHQGPVTGLRLMRTYGPTVGGIQVLYACLFGWIAFLFLSRTAEQMSRVAQNGFSFEGEIKKGEYFPAIDARIFTEGSIWALLSLSGFIGGCGLVGLRSWARRWEIAYLIFASGFSLWDVMEETRIGRDLGQLGFFYAIFAVPYLPFLFKGVGPERFTEDASCPNQSPFTSESATTIKTTSPNDLKP